MYWLLDATTSSAFKYCSIYPHCIYVFCIWLKKTATFALYNPNWLVLFFFITKMKSVTVQYVLGLYIKHCMFVFKWLNLCESNFYGESIQWNFLNGFKNIQKGGNRKHTTLTPLQKLEIIRRHESGKSWGMVLAAYNIRSSTVYDIKKQRNKLWSFVASSENMLGLFKLWMLK